MQYSYIDRRTDSDINFGGRDGWDDQEDLLIQYVSHSENAPTSIRVLLIITYL